MASDERKAELERKKQKLAEIRLDKARREQERNRQLLAHKETGDGTQSQPPSNADIDRILAEVDIPPQPTPPISKGDSTQNERGSSPNKSPARTILGHSRPTTLVKTDINVVNIEPKEQVMYSKGAQTDSDSADREFSHLHSNDWWEDDDGALGRGVHAEDSPQEEVFKLDESPSRTLQGLLPHIQLVRPTEVIAPAEEPPKLVDLSEEEKLQILTQPEFVDFFDRTSRILERALTEEVDIFVDYSRDPGALENVDSGAKITLVRSFLDEKWSKGRCVTCLDYSAHHPELIAASYNNNAHLQYEPEGVVAIWNSKFKKDTPEYVYHCPSRVTSVALGKFHPNLILGGSYSGQICLWDNRHSKKTPVQRSPLSTSAHTHPVYSLQVVGSQNAHNLISVSTDGRMCAWSLDMLSQPQEALDLSAKQNRPVASMCLSFPQNDVNNFVVGSEDGWVHSGCRHGVKAGITESFDGHYGPITGVDCHKAVGPVDFTPLAVTSSFDWTVKLWSTKESGPLHSFEDHQDYVYDVTWSPNHPALFACVDGTGRVDVWNLNQDTELPAASVYVEGRPALNKCMWMQSGQQLVVGDDCGGVWLYDVSESLSIPKQDEWHRLAKTLLDLKRAKAEAEELSQVMASTTLR